MENAEVYLMQNLDKLSSWDIFIIKLKIACAQLLMAGFVVLGIVILIITLALVLYIIEKIKNNKNKNNKEVK